MPRTALLMPINAHVRWNALNGTNVIAREAGKMSIRLVLAMSVLVCLAGAMTISSPAAAQDVQAYCAKVGNDDRVQPIPAHLVPTARRIFEFSAEMSDAFVRSSTSVRCMNGSAWVCSYGANLICGKADVSRVSRGAQQFCRQNPDSTGVPMSATGHATIYEWGCVGREARIVGQTTQVDERGFIAENWKPLE